MQKIHYVLLVILSVLIFNYACVYMPNTFTGLAPGFWRGQIILNENKQLLVTKHKDEVISRNVNFDEDKLYIPFNFEIKYKDKENFYMEVINAEERIIFDEVKIGRDIRTGNDTFQIDLSPYDACLKGYFDADKMQGQYIVRDKKNYSIVFEAKYGQTHRFEKIPANSSINPGGKWQLVFDKDSSDVFAGVGEFEMKENQKVIGTIRTETGDFRYLEGQLSGSRLRLSTFDGAHAMLFDFTIYGDSLAGQFYSGKHYKASVEGKRTNSPLLASADTLTKIKIKDAINFSFPNSQGKMISLSDAVYNNKIKLVLISGTWCPNCRDEAEFLMEYIKSKPDPDLKIITLSFERTADFDRSAKRIANYKEKLQIPWEILYAGISNRDSASLKIPQIDGIKSYPTMLFINRKNQIKKIHTGFDGPATSKFIEFKKEFETTLTSLKNE